MDIQKLKSTIYSISIRDAHVIEWDKNFKPNKIIKTLHYAGTAFGISEKYLLSAYHIVSNNPPKNNLLDLYNPNFNSHIVAKIIKSDPESDLMLLEILGTNNITYFDLSEDNITLGKLVYWAGYPTLIGENPSRRIRLAQGIVASDPYKNKTGEFFEVDGIFNPGNSGGPLIDSDSGKIIGVISASVGSPLRYLSELMAEARRVKTLSTLAQTGGSGFVSTRRFGKDYDPILLQKEIDELGLLQTKVKDIGEFYEIAINVSDVLASAINKTGNMVEILNSVAQLTYQMGLGIATSPISMRSFLND